MARDTLTLKLNGSVPLAAFAKVLEDFNKLVISLTDEVVGSLVPVEWEIIHLEGGSALTMIRGLHQDLDQVEAVVEAYSILTQAIEQRQIPPYSEDVIRHATAITKVLNSHITSVAFITDDYQAVINEPVKYSQKKHYTLGLVNGFVRTITDSPRIRLALFDSIFKQRVWCELEPDQQELARNVWRKQVSVTGSIYRAPSNGRPIQVRNISDVKIVEQVQPGSYRQARGIVPWREGDEPSEVIIRRIRDAS